MPSRRHQLLDRAAAVGITRSVLVLCALWLVALGPIVQDLSAQGAPRLALTGAILDDRDIKIDDYLVGFDFTERDGHIYSDKAPGQEVLALPVYGLSQAVGAEPAVVERVEANLTLWWVTFWSSGIPAVGLILLMAMACHRRGRPIPAVALGALSFGTMLAPMGVTLYGHVLGAALGYAAWVVLDRRTATLGRGAAAGALVALAVTVEYQVAIVGLVLAGLLAARRAWGALAAYALACIPFAAALAAYQDAAFGSPLASGYTHKSYHEGATLLITGIPKVTTAAAMLFGSRGLLLFTPIVAVGLWGLVHLWRRERDEGVVASVAVVAGFLLLQAGWVNAWGGGGPGPRYVIPMLPFLAIGLAAVWHRVPAAVARFVVGISLTTMLLASFADHLIPHGGFLLTSSLRELVTNGPNPTLWTIALGPAGWILHLAAIAATLALVVRTVGNEPVASPGAAADGSGPNAEVTAGASVV
jgi:hypothetical protein